MAKESEDGSYNELIKNTYGANKTNIYLNQNYKEYNIIRPDEIVLQINLLLSRSGYYNYNSGSLSGQSLNGNFWTKKIASDTDTRFLGFDYVNLSPKSHSNKRNGFSVRCVAK